MNDDWAWLCPSTCSRSSGSTLPKAVRNDIKNGNQLIVSGSVAITDNTAWMQSPGGNAVRFGNVDDELRAEIPASQVRPTAISTLAIDFRIYPRAYKGDNQIILGLYQDGQSDARWQVFYPPSWEPPQIPHVRGPSTTLLPAADWDQHVTLDTWHRVRITLDASGVSRVYIDDMSTALGTLTLPPAYRLQDWTLSLGNFDGDIDELRISTVPTTPP